MPLSASGEISAVEKLTGAVTMPRETVIEELVADEKPAVKTNASGALAEDINWVTEIPGFSTF